MRQPIDDNNWNNFRNNYCPQLPVRVPQPQPAPGQFGVVPIHNNAGQVIAYANAIDNEPIYINQFLYADVANNNGAAAAAPANNNGAAAAAAAAAPANNNNNNNFNPQLQYPVGDPNNDNLGAMYDGGVSQFRKRNLSRKSRKQMRGGMKIIVKTLLDRSYTLDVETSNTVKDVKEKIALLEHVPSERQRLILAGIQLNDYRTLADYNVQENQLLHVIFNRFPEPEPIPQPPRIV
jgi:ubiquitin C